MAFIYEVNGQRVEFEREPTEQDIDEAARQLGTAAMPEPSSTMGAGGVVSAATRNIPTGAAQAGKVITSAVAPFATEMARGYVAKPLTAVADALLMNAGIPPLVGPAATGMDRLALIKQGALEASKQASMGAPTLSPVKGVPTTATVRPYFDMLKSAPSEVADKISNMWNTGGGNNAVKSWLNSAEGQAIRKAIPEFGANAARYIEAAPSALQQAGRMMKPLAVGAARVAGPVGLAYDVSQAMPYLEQAEVGRRTQSGEVGQMMRQARRAQLNAPTAAPLTAQEAANLVASGDQRMMQIYKEDAELKNLMRRKAAEKVLGPVAPR
jgi:hypothetical protein